MPAILSPPDPPCGALGGGLVGSTPFGTMGFGLMVAAQVSLTSIRVDFFHVPAPQIFSRFRDKDALNHKNWELSVLSPFGAFTPLVQLVEQVGEKSVEVFTDVRLDPGVRYRIKCTALNTLGQPMLCPENDFLTFKERLIDLGDHTDIANPNLIADAPVEDPPPLGTNQITDRGDLALDGGRAYLRKRVFRRVATPLGGFYHLPGYGFSEPIKGLFTPDLVRRVKQAAEIQIRREPDVSQVRATAVRRPTDDSAKKNVLFVTLKIKDVRGIVTTQTVPIDTGDL